MEQGIALVAERVARRYARRVFWAEEDDLRQEAYAVALTACRSWDPAVGVPLAAYVWRACVLGLRSHLWRSSAPVAETDHRLHTLRGVHRAPLEEALLVESPTAARPDEACWREEVREQVSYVLARGQVDARLALPVLAGELPARMVAQRFDVPVVRVYRTVRRARLLLENNALLYTLWQDHDAR